MTLFFNICFIVSILNLNLSFAGQTSEQKNIKDIKKKAESLQSSGHYDEAAKLYRILAKEQEGQESEDGESLSAWDEANAIICECMAGRKDKKTESDADSFLKKIKGIAIAHDNPNLLSALFSCEVLVGNWESEFEPSKGPEMLAKEVITSLNKVTRSAKLNNRMIIEVAGKNPKHTNVFDAEKDKTGWLVRRILRANASDFDSIVSQSLPGAKIIKEL